MVLTDQNHVSDFQFAATIPPVVSGADDKVLGQVARGVYSQMLDVLAASGFHHQDDLELRLTSKGFELVFKDADLGFQFGMVDGKILLRRDGSTIARFDAWYSQLMPSIGSLVDQVLAGMREFGDWNRVEVLRAQMSFQLIAYDFRELSSVTSSGGSAVKNSRLMSRLISSVPDAEGRLSAPDGDGAELGRVDYGVSRWVDVGGTTRLREIYNVEAPGNRNYSGLWFTYLVSGETYNESEVSRLPFDFAAMIGDNGRRVYEELFRARFLDNFVPDVLNGYSFQTTAGQLP